MLKKHVSSLLRVAVCACFMHVLVLALTHAGAVVELGARTAVDATGHPSVRLMLGSVVQAAADTGLYADSINLVDLSLSFLIVALPAPPQGALYRKSGPAFILSVHSPPDLEPQVLQGGLPV